MRANPIRLNKGEKRQRLGIYTGKKIAVEGGYVETSSAYCFDTDQADLWVDAEKAGNWTRFINHSETPNLEIEIKDGKVYFVLIRDIEAGEQLTFDYGKHFFSNLNPPIQPCYFDSKHDNWKITKERYAEANAKDVYYPSACRLKKDIAKGLGLDPHHFFMVTRLLTGLREENAESFRKEYLDNTQDPNSPIYIVEKKTNEKGEVFYEFIDEQEHMTPLMLACYLGDKDKILALLSRSDVDINRRTLQTGNTALFYLLKGKGDVATKEAVFKKFFKRDFCLTLSNRDGENLLSLATENHLETVTTILLEKLQTSYGKAEFAAYLLEENVSQRDLFTSWSIQGQFGALAFALKSCHQQKIKAALKDEEISVYLICRDAPVKNIRRSFKLFDTHLSLHRHVNLLELWCRKINERMTVERNKSDPDDRMVNELEQLLFDIVKDAMARDETQSQNRRQQIKKLAGELGISLRDEDAMDVDEREPVSMGGSAAFFSSFPVVSKQISSEPVQMLRRGN